MTTETHVTLMRDPKEVTEQPDGGGVLIHGLFIEGARWPVGDEVEKDEKYLVGNTLVGGSLVDGSKNSSHSCLSFTGGCL
jgi:hypothetical protein